jgi:hypothetical protein
MEVVSEYKYLGLLSVCLLLCGLVFVIMRWPQGKHLTFSQHVAKQKQSIIYYSVLFCITLPLLLLFFVGWFSPTFNLPVWSNIFVIASSATQIACTLIPEVGGWKTKYHRALAGISAICLIPALLFIALTSQINNLSKVLAMLGVIIMLGIIIALIRNGGKHSHFLILQSAYFAVFFIPVLTAAYL